MERVESKHKNFYIILILIGLVLIIAVAYKPIGVSQRLEESPKSREGISKARKASVEYREYTRAKYLDIVIRVCAFCVFVAIAVFYYYSYLEVLKRREKMHLEFLQQEMEVSGRVDFALEHNKEFTAATIDVVKGNLKGFFSRKFPKKDAKEALKLVQNVNDFWLNMAERLIKFGKVDVNYDIDPQTNRRMIVLFQRPFNRVSIIEDAMLQADGALGQHLKFINALAYMFCKRNYENTISLGLIWKYIPQNLVEVIVRYLHGGFSILAAAKIGKEIYLQPCEKNGDWHGNRSGQIVRIYRKRKKE